MYVHAVAVQLKQASHKLKIYQALNPVIMQTQTAT